MAQRRKALVSHDTAAEQEMRDQEALRANKELAAYFSGQRTEREARAALKVLKAFVRDRERRDTKSRPPLPGAKAAKTRKAVANRKAARDGGERRRPKPRRKVATARPRKVTEAVERPANPELPPALTSDERTPE
jgi:hypothetical protein